MSVLIAFPRQLVSNAVLRYLRLCSVNYSSTATESVVNDDTSTDTAEEHGKELGVMTGLSCFKDGPDPVIKPDSEYPDWLWTLMDLPKSIDDIPKTEKRYWRKLNKEKIRKQNMIKKQKKF